MPVQSRRKPSSTLQADILIAQANRCAYCLHEFGDPVYDRAGDVLEWREVHWDHFRPYALTGRNDGWVAACGVCNRIKSSLVFASIADARVHIRGRHADKGYLPLPLDWDDNGEAIFYEKAPDPASPPAKRPDIVDTEEDERRAWVREVRKWAQEQGLWSQRGGRIPDWVAEAYCKRNQTPPGSDEVTTGPPQQCIRCGKRPVARGSTLYCEVHRGGSRRDGWWRAILAEQQGSAA